MQKKTNAMRILEASEIEFKVLEYPVDENNLEATHAAEFLGLPAEQVFKTIVLKNEQNEVYVFCVPSNSTVNLKLARALTNSKDINPVKVSELLGLTGYIRGGCSPLGMKKKFPTFIDETAILFDEITVSAGQRGVILLVNTEKLAAACDAKIVQVCA